MLLTRVLLFVLLFAVPVTARAESRLYAFLLGGSHISPIDFRFEPDDIRSVEHNINDFSLHIGSGVELLARPTHKPGANFSIGLEVELGYLFGKRHVYYCVAADCAPGDLNRLDTSTGLDLAGILRLNLHTGPMTVYVKGGGGGTTIKTNNNTKFTGNARGGGGAEFDVGNRNIKVRIDYTFIQHRDDRFRDIVTIRNEKQTHLIRAGFVQRF